MRKNIAQKGIPKEKMTAVPMAVSIKDTPFFGYDLRTKLQAKKQCGLPRDASEKPKNGFSP